MDSGKTTRIENWTHAGIACARNFGVNGGLIIGLGIGLMLEQKYVGFEPSSIRGKKVQMALRSIIGLMLVFAIMFGMSSLLPTEVYWLRAIRYALCSIVVTFACPFLFQKLPL